MAAKGAKQPAGSKWPEKLPDRNRKMHDRCRTDGRPHGSRASLRGLVSPIVEKLRARRSSSASFAIKDCHEAFLRIDA